MVLATGNVLFKDNWKSTGTTLKFKASTHTPKLNQNFIPGHIGIVLPKSACRKRTDEGNDSYHRNHVSNLMVCASSQNIVPTKFGVT